MLKKNDILSFDPTNLVDIENFSTKLNHIKEENISDEFLYVNLEATINQLNKTIDVDLTNIKSRKLISLLTNLTFKTKSKSTEFRERIIKLNLYQTFSKIFNYLIKLNESTYEYKNQDLAFLITSLNNLTFESEKIAQENVRNGVVKLALDCLNVNNYLENLNNNQLTTKDSLYLFDSTIRFLLSNSEEPVIKQELDNLRIVETILEHKKRLDESLKKFPRMSELKIIEVRFVCILACLMNDDELETQLNVSRVIVEKLIQMLNETITKSKSNLSMLNTRFYLTYDINLVATYVYARSIMKRFLNISVNDTVKQIIFESNGLTPILKLLQSGNEREKFISSELICSLCFNKNVRSYLQDKKIMKIIEDTFKNTKNNEIKNQCYQIIEMVNGTLEKRVTVSAESNLPNAILRDSAKTDSCMIMISYNSKYRDQCMKMNNELKKRGYKTWIDVEQMSSNLFDDMADAVEKASVILICYSEEYRKSANCRLEAEYAFKQNKPMVFVRLQQGYKPEGWIGLMIGQRLYVDLSADSDFQKAINDINKQIDSFRVTSPLSNTAVQVLTQDSDIKDDNVKNWNGKKIQNWLISTNLNEFVPVFHDYDGFAFQALWNLKQDSSERFYASIDAEISEKQVKIPNKKKLIFYTHFTNLFS